MTNTDFERIVKRLQPSLPGMVAKPPFLFCIPLRGVLRGLCFERSSSPRAFYVWVFALPLCVPTKYVNFSLGKRIGVNNRGDWSIDNPNLSEELLLSIRDEAIPFLNSAEPPEKIITLAQMFAKNSKSPYPQQAAAYMLAQTGNYQAAIEAIDRLIKLLVTGAPWEAEIAARADMLKSLLSGDPTAAKEQLAEWETETVRNLGLMETNLVEQKK
jgi:hypothetical protein